MRLSSLKTVCFAAALAAFVGATISAQGQQQPPAGRGRAPQNLQVLPKDWTFQQVQQTMRGVAAALGVECSHCHVSQQDRASDAKPEKLKARKMFQIMASINDLMKDVGEPPAPGAAKVTCFTCHRGALKPLTAPAAGGGY